MTTTTAWAAKSPDGRLYAMTVGVTKGNADLKLAMLRKSHDEPTGAAAVRLLSAGWRIVKVKIEEME